MPTLRYELQVWAAGVQTTTGSPAFTLRAQLGHPGFTIPGQIVRPAEGRAESQSWQCTVVDVGSTFTAKLASTAGRMWLLNRLARLRVAQDSTASSSYQTVATQRITDVALGENIAEYSLTLNDERFIERNTELFGKIASPTVSLYPGGFLVDWNGYTPLPKQNQNWRPRGTPFFNLRPLQCIQAFADTAVAQAILADIKPDVIPPTPLQTAGAFQFLRYHDFGTGNDYEIATFDYGATIDLFPIPIIPQSIAAFWRGNYYLKSHVIATVVDPSSALTGNRQGYLYMPNAPASVVLPYHIGGSGGRHPFRIAQDAYDGTFSSSTGLLARYNTAAFTVLQDDPKYGLVYFRVTQPEMMDQWLEPRLYGPFNVAPLLDSSGQVAPKALHLPQNVNPVNYTTLTATNLRHPHPSWTHPSREAVTALVFQVDDVRPDPSTAFVTSADHLISSTSSIRKSHDTLQTLGKHEVTFQLPMFAARLDLLYNFFPPAPPGASPQSIANLMARELFDRFGDGPIRVECPATPAVDATTNGRTNPGQFVLVNLATLPNPATLARSGTRIMQVLSRGYDPRGPVFTLLDAGPNLQPTSAPSIAVVRSSQSTRHGVKVTVSGLAAGSNFLVQLAKSSSTGSTTPATNSSRWWVPSAGVGTTANTVFHVGSLPAGYKIWGRAQSQRPGRIRSAWSASASTVLAKLPGLTFRITTGITGGWAVTKWTLGSTVYPIAYYLKLSTASGLTSTQLVTKLSPRTTSFTIEGLKPSTKYRWGVRHVDLFGGQSTLLTTSFATSTALTAAPQPRGLKILS